MSGVAVATAVRAGAASVTVTNRTAAKATRLAGRYGAATAPWGDLVAAVADADVVLACTGAAGRIITPEVAAAAHSRRDGRPQVYVDLALPRDVDQDVAALPGVQVVGLAELGAILAGDAHVPPQVEAVRELVTTETSAYLAYRRQQHVAPTVTALRRRAAAVVDAELERLDGRLPDLVHTHPSETIAEAVQILSEYGVSQMPVVRAEPPIVAAEVAGSVSDRVLLDLLYTGKAKLTDPVEQHMSAPLPTIGSTEEAPDVVGDLLLDWLPSPR